MMEHKGYLGKVEYDPENDLFHGEVVGTRDLITFEGRSVDELHQEFAKSVEVYLKFCDEVNKSPDRPFSGRFIARIDSDLHRAIVMRAALSGLSLNAWVVQALQKAASPPADTPRDAGRRTTHHQRPTSKRTRTG